MKKRLLAILLTLAMVLSLVPMTALAEASTGNESTITDVDGKTWTVTTSDNTITMTTGSGEETTTITAELDEDGTLTISGNGAMPNLNKSTNEESISEGAGVYPWADWRNPTDENANRIKKIVISDGITSIGSKAFIAARSVTSVEIGKDVTEIGAGAFGQLYACTEFKVAEGNTAFVDDDGVLYNTDKTILYYYPCAKTGEKFEVPASVTLLGYNSIYSSVNLKAITFAESSDDLIIGYGAIAMNNTYVTNDVLETIELPGRVKKVCTAAFLGHSDLIVKCETADVKALADAQNTSSDIHVLLNSEDIYTDEDAGYKYIYSTETGEATIIKYIGTASEIEVPSSVTINGQEYKVTAIGLAAFGTEVDSANAVPNTTIKKVTVPSSVTSIARYAFRYCIALEELTVQGSEMSLDLTALLTYGTQNSVTVDLSAVKNLTVTTTTGQLTGISKLILNYENQLEAFKGLNMNNGTEAQIAGESDYYWLYNEKDWQKSAVETVGLIYKDNNGVTWTFTGNVEGATITGYSPKEGTTSVTVPSTVTADGKSYSVVAIGKGLFEEEGDAHYIESVTLPDTVAEIGADAFRYAGKLSYIKISGTEVALNADGGSARTFSGASGLKVLDMSAVESITFDSSSTSSTSFFAGMGSSNSPAVIYVSSDTIKSDIGDHRSTKSPCHLIYAITNGGTFPENTEFSSNSLAAPTRDGYTFDSWYENADFTGDAVTNFAAEKTYYAKWNSTITFDANGGTGTMAVQTIGETDTFTTLTANGFTKTGYTFDGWNTAADGSGTSYADQATEAGANGNITLYAQWTANTYTINFDGGTEASGSTDSVTATYDQPATLTTNGFTLTGKNFAGWATEQNATTATYSDGATVENLTAEASGTVTLYAVWTDKQVLTPDKNVQTKTYNGNSQEFKLEGGYTIAYQQNGSTVTTPTNAGSYDVVISHTGDDTYAPYPATTISGGLVITPATLTITADNKSIYVDDALPEYTYTVTGLVGNDTESVITTKPTVTCSDADANTAGTYTITASGANAGENYTITYVVGTLNVSSRPSGGGGFIPSITVQKPTISTGDGYTVSTGSVGTTATINVQEGYELVDVVVNGVSKGKVTTLTGLKTGDKVEVKVVKKEELSEVEKVQAALATVTADNFKARSKQVKLKNGKKAVKITWNNTSGIKFDGVEVFRSVKRYSGYGKKPIFSTEKNAYYNTAITKGTKYYYKVRGYVEIDGVKYYTDWSAKAWRTVK